MPQMQILADTASLPPADQRLTGPQATLLNSIYWGQQLYDYSITVYFAPAGYVADGFSSEGFNAYELAQFRAAFDLIENVTNLTFSVVSATAADFVLLLDTNEIYGAFLAYFNPPGTYNAGVGVFDGGYWDRSPGGDLQLGGYSFTTITHEVLHGLGLAHPHDTGGTSTIMPGVTSDFGSYGVGNLNQGVFTTMSYNTGYLTGGAGTGGDPAGNWGYEVGPMALDIAVLQELYGANMTTATGNDVYVLPTANQAGTYWQCIWDAGGVDEIRHTGNTSSVIDLRPATLLAEVGGGGFISAASGIAGGFTVAAGVVIENATGGSGADLIIGNDAANRLIGGSGFDVLYGGAGADFLDGGAHADELHGDDGNDRLIGGSGFDNLYGDAGNDTLLGGDTADRLYGGIGNDSLSGGSNYGYTVDGLFGEAGDDTLRGDSGFDHLDGGDGNDYLDGGHQADNLYGRAGDDTLDGGLGFDRLFGGTGNDLLIGGQGTDGLFGQQGNDTLRGGTESDRVWGGPGNDDLSGDEGADVIYGGGGFDRIDGGTGNDTLSGNFNADIFVFADGHGDDIVTDFAATNPYEKIDLSAVSAITGLSDLLSNHASQVGTDVLIDTGGGNSILLQNVALAQLDASDFIF